MNKGLSPSQCKIVILSGQRRPIASSAYLNKIYGVACGVFYNQLLYWEGKQANKQGWIRKSKKESYDETGVTLDQQDRAVKIGLENGFLEQSIMSIPGTRHLRIDVEKFIDFTAEKAKSMGLVSAKELIKFGGKQGTNIHKTTQKTTSYIGTDDQISGKPKLSANEARELGRSYKRNRRVAPTKLGEIISINSDT